MHGESVQRDQWKWPPHSSDLTTYHWIFPVGSLEVCGMVISSHEELLHSRTVSLPCSQPLQHWDFEVGQLFLYQYIEREWFYLLFLFHFMLASLSLLLSHTLETCAIMSQWCHSFIVLICKDSNAVTACSQHLRLEPNNVQQFFHLYIILCFAK